MQVTNGQIWLAAVPAEGELSPVQEILKERWPIKTSYWLTKLARKLGEHLRDIQATRTELFQRYGTPSEDGKLINVPSDSEHWPAFREGYDALMNETVEIDAAMAKIPLPLNDSVSLSPQTLMFLEPFVEITE